MLQFVSMTTLEDLDMKQFIVVCSSVLLFTVNILKFFVLPFTYEKIENHTENTLIKNFFNNLKFSNKNKLLLVFSLFVFLLFPILKKYDTITNFVKSLPVLLGFDFIFGLLGCYTIVFLLWSINKKNKTGHFVVFLNNAFYKYGWICICLYFLSLIFAVFFVSYFFHILGYSLLEIIKL